MAIEEAYIVNKYVVYNQIQMFVKSSKKPLTLCFQRAAFASTFGQVDPEQVQATSLKLKRSPEANLIAQQWSLKPFQVNEPMQVPVFDFVTGGFQGDVATLDHAIFNQPLRRDIIHNVFRYFEMKDKKLYKLAKGFGDVAGSGKKPTPQKGRGAARQGNKRAPQRAGGGVAHGPVPRDLYFPVNLKLRLQALKTMLSAKLYEDKIIFINSEEIDYPKTQFLSEVIKPYGMDKLCFLVGQEPALNFQKASKNIQNVQVALPTEFNLPHLLRSDYVIITRQGLTELEHLLESRHANYFRNKKVPTEEGKLRMANKKRDPYVREIIKPILEAEEPEFNDEELLTIQSESLRSYIDDLRRLQAQSQEQ